MTAGDESREPVPTHHLTVLASGVLDAGTNPLNLMTAVKSVADTAEAGVPGILGGQFTPIDTGLPGHRAHTGHLLVSGEFRIALVAADAAAARAFAARLDTGLKALRGSARELGFAWLATERTEVLG